VKINVHIAQYAAEYVKNFHKNLGDDPAVPDLPIQNFGYLYLADNEQFKSSSSMSRKLN